MGLRTAAIKPFQPLFLWRTFHLARLFLLPTLRLRLGFAIYISVKEYPAGVIKSFKRSVRMLV